MLPFSQQQQRDGSGASLSGAAPKIVPTVQQQTGLAITRTKDTAKS
ncbi:MAG: hypothetical protein ACKJSK_09660 [Roseibacillus sp.]